MKAQFWPAEERAYTLLSVRYRGRKGWAPKWLKDGVNALMGKRDSTITVHAHNVFENEVVRQPNLIEPVDLGQSAWLTENPKYLEVKRSLFPLKWSQIAANDREDPLLTWNHAVRPIQSMYSLFIHILGGSAMHIVPSLLEERARARDAIPQGDNEASIVENPPTGALLSLLETYKMLPTGKPSDAKRKETVRTVYERDKEAEKTKEPEKALRDCYFESKPLRVTHREDEKPDFWVDENPHPKLHIRKDYLQTLVKMYDNDVWNTWKWLPLWREAVQNDELLSLALGSASDDDPDHFVIPTFKGAFGLIFEHLDIEAAMQRKLFEHIEKQVKALDASERKQRVLKCRDRKTDIACFVEFDKGWANSIKDKDTSPLVSVTKEESSAAHSYGNATIYFNAAKYDLDEPENGVFQEVKKLSILPMKGRVIKNNCFAFLRRKGDGQSGGKPLQLFVLTVHLESGDKKQAQREEEMSRVREILDLIDGAYHILVTGDFNMEKRHKEDLFEETFPTNGGWKCISQTIYSTRHDTNTAPSTGEDRGEVLDYIYYRPPVTSDPAATRCLPLTLTSVTKPEVTTDTSLDENVPVGERTVRHCLQYWGSDHVPVAAQVFVDS